MLRIRSRTALGRQQTVARDVANDNSTLSVSLTLLEGVEDRFAGKRSRVGLSLIACGVVKLAM